MKKHLIAIVALFVILTDSACAKCNPRVCFDGEVEILSCVEDQQLSKTYADSAVRYNDEFFRGLRAFKLTGVFHNAKPCEGALSWSPGSTSEAVAQFVNTSLEFVDSSRNLNYCEQRKGRHLVNVWTGCCDDGATRLECERPLLIKSFIEIDKRDNKN